MIEILYKSENAVVIYKPHGVPSQSDLSRDADAMTMTAEALSRLCEDEKLWLIHRLDRNVGGLLVFARNKESARELSELVRDRLVIKQYLAVIEGEGKDGVLKDFLYKDARNNKAYIVDRKRAGVKEAVLSYRTLAVTEKDGGVRSLVYITLHTGRFHQIRAQFSSRGMPLCGDKKYGSRDIGTRNIALASTHLKIQLSDDDIDLIQLPNIETYPWNLFDRAVYEEIYDEN